MEATSMHGTIVAPKC